MKRWNESKTKAATARAKRSALGRILCRLTGDRTGGVLLEYVLLAVFVAAAVAAAVWFLGGRIRSHLEDTGKIIDDPTHSGDRYEAQKAKGAADATTTEAQGRKFQ